MWTHREFSLYIVIDFYFL